MLTKNEIAALNLSPTKKDFVQIWNELLEVAGKLSERWDPTSTNESDPGIVILKALTGIADRLNYNIDKNILEAFMPTAAQEDSMRKLCEMLGYNIKYYTSATAQVMIRYHDSDAIEKEFKLLELPKFTVITNSDRDLSYFTTEPVFVSSSSSVIVNCIEGQLVKCESLNADNIITVNNIVNNRYYLPETQIAENGIYIYNVGIKSDKSGIVDGDRWEKVDNLNVLPRATKAYKFGFDSYQSRPFIEFPADYSELFNEGIFIYYTRTSGANGNASARTLTSIELPATGDWSEFSAENFNVENPFASQPGADIETIPQAYTNFKKTIGTFETLVTCRDYMNKICQLSDDNGRLLVSNNLVTDIRTDLNRAITICSCDDSGIFYKETAIGEDTEIYTEVMKPVFNENGSWHLGSSSGMELAKTKFITSNNSSAFKTDQPGIVYTGSDSCWAIEQNGVQFTTNLSYMSHSETPALSHFDLVLYPFKIYNQINNYSGTVDIRKIYDTSFEYNAAAIDSIVGELGENKYNIKTIAHNMIPPRYTKYNGNNILSIGDITSINNYLRLNATITTTSKITTDECKILINKIKTSLANAFNMHELDFGEEIPFDSIVSVIESADPKIRIAVLNEPVLYTTFSVVDTYDNGIATTKEYAVASDFLSVDTAKTVPQLEMTYTDTRGNIKPGTFDTKEARKIYNKLAVRNVLAGRVPLFNYNKTFKSNFSEGAYLGTRTTLSSNVPEALQNIEVTIDNPFAIYSDSNSGKTYTKHFLESDNTVEYRETYIPENCQDLLTTINNNNITNIETSCKIISDKPNGVASIGEVNNVKLAAGEYVKFRAPNLRTVTTYPAYVNYHLALDTELLSKAENARAVTLFELMSDIGWQKALDYFEAIDTNTARPENDKYKQLIEHKQKVSGYTITDEEQNSNVINIETANEEQKDLSVFLRQCGCIKFSNKHNIEYDSDKKRYLVKPILKWADGTDGSPDLDFAPIAVEDIFITESNILNEIDLKVTEYLNGLINETNEDGSPVLPNNPWYVVFEYEGVSFSAASYFEWENFIKASDASDDLTFKPVIEDNTLFWRVYGEGYDTGKYILSNTSKLIKFNPNENFGLLPAIPMQGIFVCEYLGKSAEPATIKNNEERVLKANEYLYIEYTPSSTTDEDSAEAITKVYGPGTIIRPNGFEDPGLEDSTVYGKSNSAFKKVTFESVDGTPVTVDMQRFGANEQVEIRELAKVVLTKNSFKNSNAIYYYKNFSCPELEDLKLINTTRTYTLKDGEYIFYTDYNKAEFAYFASGTQITVQGRLCLHAFDVIDISSIFSAGMDAIPWRYLSFSTNDDALILQEYQYITLGQNDSIKHISLNGQKEYISDAWQYCDNVEYTLAGSTESERLPKINIFDGSSDIGVNKGCGWEVSSTLALDVSYDSTQTLRNTDKVQTSFIISSTSPSGALVSSSDPILPIDSEHPLSFKTNLGCHSYNGKVDIRDLLYNPDKLPGFELKLFSSDEPVIVETEPGKVVPCKKDGIVDITNWKGEPIATRANTELWYAVSLNDIKIKDTENDKEISDHALRLPITILPNTYGVFSIYLKYSTNTPAKTWIEVLPGTTDRDITLLNTQNVVWERAEASTNNSDKLLLNPGINCIRVNKTGKIFIKASTTAQGTLCFDELKLVNCQQIECANPVDESADPIILTTQGLNTKQLGYLNSNDYTELPDIIDSDMYDTFKSGYIDSALNEAEKFGKEIEKNVASTQKDALKDKQLVEKLNAFVQHINNELISTESAYTANKDKFLIMLQEYTELYDRLCSEEALLAALDNNKNIEVLGQKLIEALENFAPIDSYVEQLLEELEQLKKKIINNTAKFSKEDILSDFDDAADMNDYKLRNEFKPVFLDLINSYYDKQLTSIASSIEKVTDSESRSKLLTIIEKLQEDSVKEQQLLTLANVKQLIDTVDTTQIMSLLNTAYKSALEPNYYGVTNALTELHTYLSTYEFRVLVSKIENAINDNADSLLADFINELHELSDIYADENETTPVKQLLMETQGLLKYINGQGYLNTEVPVVDQDGVVTPIDNLRGSSFANFLTTISNISEDIQKTLNEIKATSYVTTLENIKDATNDQAKEILEKLNDILISRGAFVDNLISYCDEFNPSDDSDKSRFKAFTNWQEAVVYVWPEHMESALREAIDKYYGYIYNILKGIAHGEHYDSDNIILPSVNISATRKVMLEKLESDKFSNLCTRLEKLIDKQKQFTSRVYWTNNFISKLGLPTELANALDNIPDDNKLIQAIAILLQDGISSNDCNALETAQLMSELRTELSLLINTDRALINAASELLLCPSILLFENISKIYSIEIDDNFYKNIKDKLKSSRELLLACKDTNDLSTCLNNIRNIFNASADALNSILKWLQDGLYIELAQDHLTDSLLSDDYMEILDDFMTYVSQYNELISIRSISAALYDMQSSTITTWLQENITNTELCDIFNKLVSNISKLEEVTSINEASKKAYDVLLVEKLLMSDLQLIDKNRDFYYTAPVDTSLSIEFNESEDRQNTLANPIFNYDINNINNNFVISKLDINYLDKGLQIARSSVLT